MCYFVHLRNKLTHAGLEQSLSASNILKARAYIDLEFKRLLLIAEKIHTRGFRENLEL